RNPRARRAGQRADPSVSGDNSMVRDPHDLAALMDRLDKLEDQNRRLRRALAFLLLLGSAGLWAGQGRLGPDAPQARAAEAKSKTVLTERLVLVDANGKPRAELGLDHGDPFFQLANGAGKAQIILRLGKEVAGINFLDEKGKQRASLGLG